MALVRFAYSQRYAKMFFILFFLKPIKTLSLFLSYVNLLQASGGVVGTVDVRL